jgi:hypothetical protein
MLSRKDLPNFGVLKHISYEPDYAIQTCQRLGLFNFNLYTDIQASSDSAMSSFVRANQFSKDSFFKEPEAPSLEGNAYRQLYLTRIISSLVAEKRYLQPVFSPGRRQARLNPKHSDYNPFVDELNYSERTENVVDFFAWILDQFQSPVKRVRLAVLAPGAKIKPHIEYDASYIVRYHVPILTNPDCWMYVSRNKVKYRTHFEKNGQVYFLNSGLNHAAENLSEDYRLHLIIDVSGQHELKHLPN